MSWLSIKSFLENIKNFADKKDINVLYQQIARSIRKEKNTLSFESKKYLFRHIKGNGRGGKVLQIYSEPTENFNTSGLPTENLHEVHIANIKESNTETQLTYYELSESQKEQANQRLAILKEYESAAKRGVCVVDFIKLCKVEFPHEKINEAKLFRWKRDFRKHGIIALADKRGIAKIGTTKLKAWMQEFVITKFRAHGAGNINFYQLWDALHKEAGNRGEIDYYQFILGKVKPLCDYGVIKRFVEKYYSQNHLEHLMVTKGEDKTKSYLQPAFGNQKEIISYRNQCWQIDSSPLDIIVLDKDNKQIRPTILSIVDVYSGRCVASLDKTSNSLALVRLLWKAISKLGKPTYIKGDNGKDYLSKQFQELLNGLSIDYDRSIAYAGDEKGSVERHFGVIQHSDISFAHGYIGSSLTQREPIEQRIAKKDRTGKDQLGNPIKTNLKNLMTYKEAEQLLEETVLKWDLIRIRRKDKLSPLDKWNSDTTAIKSVEYAEFILYASDGIRRVVSKKGVVIDSMTYVSIELPHVGTEIIVRHNIDNLQEVYIFDLSGNFICVAWDKTVAALSAEDYKLAKKAFNEDVRAIRKLIRSAEASEFTKLNLAVDLEKMQQTHRQSIKQEQMVSSSNIDDIKQQIKEQKEFKETINASFDVDTVVTKTQRKKTSWEDLIEQQLKGA